MAWLGEKRKTEFSWTQANQAMSESRIFERIQHFLRYEVLEIAACDSNPTPQSLAVHFYMRFGFYELRGDEKRLCIN